eukprot:CAMPEP_0183358122 /NCGR_PEP_ID=MMETSP0164_2-20130417/48277_1 /TAXON_ID=221442 /ORGANISM="Coccolithus pelagicus ssp braarudi, Strain PLY182g" /LENGTH=69 /DNA_ID=CAMNT_0025531941 /DNA_START=532 /DNA_END=738 /DNA_ORIENTATION=-
MALNRTITVWPTSTAAPVPIVRIVLATPGDPSGLLRITLSSPSPLARIADGAPSGRLVAEEFVHQSNQN